ncbi:MBL fold metallo-hydrolase [bacterium]|nr:MBL fold metallo-hydrolase [bacterium]
MRVTFWGVRGSFPVAHPKVTRIGGNTSCVALRAEGAPLLVIDAGTGFRHLGRQLRESEFAKGKGEGALLLSHTHWDHIQGFMYFEPFFKEGNKFTVVARGDHDRKLKQIFQAQTESPYFSYGLDSFKAELTWKPVMEDEQFSIGPWRISTVRLNHPGVALGYRIEHGGRSFIYMTDTAPYTEQWLEHGFHVRKPEKDPEALDRLRAHGKKLDAFTKGADLLLYDTFFTPEQYGQNPHWGHSTPDEGLRVAREGGVKSFYFFHHHPEAWDDDLEARVKSYAKRFGSSDLRIDVAREGETIEM